MATKRTNGERRGVMASQRKAVWYVEPAPLGVLMPKHAGKWFFSGNGEETSDLLCWPISNQQ